MPGFVALVDRDAMVDEPSPNGALDFVDSPVESFAILDQRPEFSVLFRWHVNRFQFMDSSHSRQLEGIVLVGLAFDVTPRVS